MKRRQAVLAVVVCCLVASADRAAAQAPPPQFIPVSAPIAAAVSSDVHADAICAVAVTSLYDDYTADVAASARANASWACRSNASITRRFFRYFGSSARSIESTEEPVELPSSGRRVFVYGEDQAAFTGEFRFPAPGGYFQYCLEVALSDGPAFYCATPATSIG